MESTCDREIRRRSDAEIRLRRGDIVLVDLAGAEGAEIQNDVRLGARPCVVIQNDQGNAASPLTIVAPLTDAAAFKHLPVQVPVSATELGVGGKDSVVDCGQIRAIDRRVHVRKHLGTLDKAALTRVDGGIKNSLAV